MDQDAERLEERWLARALAAGVGVVCRHPWAALCLVALSCLAAGLYTWRHLTYLTHRTDLISGNKDYLKRWRQYVDEFGHDEDMVVVVRGSDRARMQAALDDIAGELARRPDAFERLFYRVDLRSLHSRSLLFLPTDQLRQIQAHVHGLSLLLEPPVLGTLDPWIGWKSLSLRELLRDSERKLQVYKADPASNAFFKQIAAVMNGASDFLETPTGYRSPWRNPLPASTVKEQEQLASPQYFFSSDGKLAFLLVSPIKEGDSFTDAQKSIELLRGILAGMKDRYPDLEVGLTGLPVLENDEMIASQNDSTLASWLALAGVALLYLVVYRGLRYPLMTVAALMVGTVWALGWLTLTVGHLNILSAAFAVMLIGMGDYGVLWVTRFTQERQAGRDPADAMRHTALHVGPSICTAALATALAFFATMLADLRAVSELGWISGCGVLLCALSCFVVTPALLAIFDAKTKLSPLPSGGEGPGVRGPSLAESNDSHWLGSLMRRPKWVFACSLVATLVLAGFATCSRYDHNLLNMQAQSLDSVQWEKKLIEHMSETSWFAVSWTTTPEEALALKAKFEELPAVSKAVTLASSIPSDQDRKLEILRDLQHRLRKLPRRGAIIEHSTPYLDDLERAGHRVLRLVTALQKDQPSTTLAQLERSILRLLGILRKGQATSGEPLDGAELSEPPVVGTGRHLIPHQLQLYEQWMARDLADDLHRLRDVSTPTRISLDDLPACLRERNLGKNGKWLVRVFGKESLWNFDPLERFISQVRTVDPEATGKPFTTLEGLKAMQNGFLWAGFYALCVMAVVLSLDFGRLRHTLVALLPLAMGMIATLGIMALCGVALNPANMIAFPLILGVGADNGVHVLHDFRSRDRTKRYRLSYATGRGIMVAALTTILGFGALMISQHRGMASLGLILAVGVACCMVTALVFLPALLYVMGKRVKAQPFGR